MVFYVVVFAASNIGLDKPNYTGIFLGISTAFTPFLSIKVMHKYKRIKMMVGFYILIALSGVLIQYLHAAGYENEGSGLLIESIFGSFLFKGGASLVHIVFLTYIKELYKVEIRNVMFSILSVIGKLLILGLPQLMDFYPRVGLHVLAGTSVWFVIGIPL